MLITIGTVSKWQILTRITSNKYRKNPPPNSQKVVLNVQCPNKIFGIVWKWNLNCQDSDKKKRKSNINSRIWVNAKYDEINEEFKPEARRRGVYKLVKSVHACCQEAKEAKDWTCEVRWRGGVTFIFRNSELALSIHAPRNNRGWVGVNFAQGLFCRAPLKKRRRETTSATPGWN